MSLTRDNLNLHAERLSARFSLEYIISGKEFSHCWNHNHFYPNECSKMFIRQMIITSKALLQLNIPIHLIPFLLFKLKTLRKE